MGTLHPGLGPDLAGSSSDLAWGQLQEVAPELASGNRLPVSTTPGSQCLHVGVRELREGRSQRWLEVLGKSSRRGAWVVLRT